MATWLERRSSGAVSVERARRKLLELLPALELPFSNLKCSSDAVLGFSATGHEILAYSVVEGALRVEAWRLDLARRACERRPVWHVVLTNLLRSLSSDGNEEFFVPLSVAYLDCSASEPWSSVAVVATRTLAKPYATGRDATIEFILSYVEQNERGERRRKQVNAIVYVDGHPYPPAPPGHAHLAAVAGGGAVLAVDAGHAIKFVRITGEGRIQPREFDAELFLSKALPKLSAGLKLLNYAVRFVGFHASGDFEGMVVALAEQASGEGGSARTILIALCVKGSVDGPTVSIVNSMKSPVDPQRSDVSQLGLERRAVRLAESRARRPASAAPLNNRPILESRPVDRLTSTALPFLSIVFDTV